MVVSFTAKSVAVPVAVMVRTLVSPRMPPSSILNAFCPPVAVSADFRPRVLEDELPPVETKLSSVEFSHLYALASCTAADLGRASWAPNRSEPIVTAPTHLFFTLFHLWTVV